jgi:hypothetical protein
MTKDQDKSDQDGLANAAQLRCRRGELALMDAFGELKVSISTYVRLGLGKVGWTAQHRSTWLTELLCSISSSVQLYDHSTRQIEIPGRSHPG